MSDVSDNVGQRVQRGAAKLSDSVSAPAATRSSPPPPPPPPLPGAGLPAMGPFHHARAGQYRLGWPAPIFPQHSQNRHRQAVMTRKRLRHNELCDHDQQCHGLMVRWLLFYTKLPAVTAFKGQKRPTRSFRCPNIYGTLTLRAPFGACRLPQFYCCCHNYAA